MALLAAVGGINLVGVWEIAVNLRGLDEQRARTVELQTAARASAIEGELAGLTADLAILAASAPLRHAREPDRAWGEEAGTALLLFLRGHPAVGGLSIRGPAGTWVEAGRPRGVAGFWLPDDREPTLDPGRGVRRRFAIAARAQGAPERVLEAVLQPELLTGAGVDAGCTLIDAGGAFLAGDAANAGPAAAEASVLAAGWGNGEPWRFRCTTAGIDDSAVLEPLVVRQRTLVVLNVVGMLLVAVLGALAYREGLRRRRLELQAAEEARVRELERKLFHAERLGTAGRLAAGIAHEINNPLEGMANYLTLAGEALDRREASRAISYLSAARNGLDRVASVVHRVLDLADPAEAMDEVLDVGDVVASSLEFVRRRPEFAAIGFSMDAAPGSLRVRGSAAMLGQVVLNLVLNACEAQPDGGSVDLRCRRSGDDILCDVADRGPGVALAMRERIFEPFETTKRSAGLGLSICHSIVARHGGDLTVHERDDGGAVFRVRLPAAERGESACA